MSSSKSFNGFTNLFSLKKTLRFELKPVGKTQTYLENDQVFLNDQNKKLAYEKTKPYFDRLHRDFIFESLENYKYEDLEIYHETYIDYKKDTKNRAKLKNLEQKRKKFRESIKNRLDTYAKKWATEDYSLIKIKKKNLDLLFEESVFQILKARYGNEEETYYLDSDGNKISIFDGWNGFTGYFIKFFETRKNFYKIDGTASAITTRIVDTNYERFLDNLSAFQSSLKNLDYSEVEKNFNIKVSDFFNVDFYNFCILQNGIDRYNEIIGGKTLANGTKLKGINEIINKYRQDNKGIKIPFLKKLDKQILSEKVQFIDEIKNQDELKKTLENFIIKTQTRIDSIKHLLNDFFSNEAKYDLSGIYISKEALNTIAYKWIVEPTLFQEKVYANLKAIKLISSSAKKADGTFSFTDFISLEIIKKALDEIQNENQIWKLKYYEEKIIPSSGNNEWNNFKKILQYEFTNLYSGTEKNLNCYINHNQKVLELIENFKINKDNKLIIKNFADSVLYLYQLGKYFAIEKKRIWVGDQFELDANFYFDAEFGYKEHFYDNAYEEIVLIYNKIRNYLTKKPFSENKWKLNFENPTLANGWDKNKEADNTAIILRKDGRFFLAIMKKGKNKIFSDKNILKPSPNEDFFEKLVYKFFPEPSKMFPKVCFSKKGLKELNPSKEIYEIYKNGEFKKGDTFNITSMQKLIAFYIDCLNRYEGWKYYEFSKIKKPNDYTENINEFYNDVSYSGYKIWFENISADYIYHHNNNGDLYLFEIYNKDFSDNSTGTKNLHTMYFNALFSKENIDANFPLMLNGQAELFFRPKSIIEIEKQKRNTRKEITNKKRYTEDKVFFHVPITLNRTSESIDRSNEFNEFTNNFLANNPDINIIGLDRGEKHLIYYSVINQKGEIIDKGSLNKINKVDYNDMLETKANERERARQDWQEVEGIKDLKKGYISQVVRKIADLAIHHNAIIVMEDLNMRFKQIRGGIEKSVYQQLEKALIDKLSYLVNKKETDLQKAGSVLHAYQLTAKFESFKEMGKQTGIIFYTQASYTSKIDPLTGWRPNLYLKYVNAKKAKEEILKFDSIKFQNNRFEFTYDLKKFNPNAKDYPSRTAWTICSNVERFRWDRTLNKGKGGYTHYIDITENLKEILKSVNINADRDILSQIEKLDENNKEHIRFLRDLIYYINMICQIRNTQQEKDGNENDFILSPVEPFFDSRKSKEFGNNLPENGDDNGAYNIARKGIIILNRLSEYKNKNGDMSGLKWDNLHISQSAWDNFAQMR
jgi:hypothetical protein